MAIGHHEQRCGQSAALQVGQQAAPGRCGFGGGELQRHQLFLPAFGNAEGRQDGHTDHTSRQADA